MKVLPRSRPARPPLGLFSCRAALCLWQGWIRTWFPTQPGSLLPWILGSVVQVLFHRKKGSSNLRRSGKMSAHLHYRLWNYFPESKTWWAIKECISMQNTSEENIKHCKWLIDSNITVLAVYINKQGYNVRGLKQYISYLKISSKNYLYNYECLNSIIASQYITHTNILQSFLLPKRKK